MELGHVGLVRVSCLIYAPRRPRRLLGVKRCWGLFSLHLQGLRDRVQSSRAVLCAPHITSVTPMGPETLTLPPNNHTPLIRR